MMCISKCIGTKLHNGGGPNNGGKMAEDSSYMRKGNQLNESLGTVGETS